MVYTAAVNMTSDGNGIDNGNGGDIDDYGDGGGAGGDGDRDAHHMEGAAVSLYMNHCISGTNLQRVTQNAR